MERIRLAGALSFVALVVMTGTQPVSGQEWSVHRQVQASGQVKALPFGALDAGAVHVISGNFAGAGDGATSPRVKNPGERDGRYAKLQHGLPLPTPFLRVDDTPPNGFEFEPPKLQDGDRAGIPWIIAGSALVVGGAIVGDDVGTVLMAGGVGFTAYGLFIYF